MSSRVPKGLLHYVRRLSVVSFSEVGAPFVYVSVVHTLYIEDSTFGAPRRLPKSLYPILVYIYVLKFKNFYTLLCFVFNEYVKISYSYFFVFERTGKEREVGVSCGGTVGVGP